MAGTFEDGLQICTLCGKVLTDYTGGGFMSDRPNAVLAGWREGPVYVTGVNPVQTTILKPLENYGGDDPYKRIIVGCTENLKNNSD